MAARPNVILGIALVTLALTSLAAVISGFFMPRQADEGAGAHMFQLSIVAVVPVTLAFIATADWRSPARPVVTITIASAIVIASFIALYHLEHP